MSQNENVMNQTSQNENEENCFCDKKQCVLWISSIAIGIGGLVLALLLWFRSRN